MNTQPYDDETIKEVEEIAENYIRNNYEDIDTVEITGVEEGQMGGIIVKGEVNGEAGFTVGIDEETFTVGSVGRKDGFPDLKEECKEQECD